MRTISEEIAVPAPPLVVHASIKDTAMQDEVAIIRNRQNRRIDWTVAIQEEERKLNRTRHDDVTKFEETANTAAD